MSLAEKRIEAAQGITREQLLGLLQNQYPSLFDQIIIEGEKRNICFYVNYEANSLERKVYSVTAPAFGDIQKDFEDNLQGGEMVYGKIRKADLNGILQKLNGHNVSPVIHPFCKNPDLPFIEIPVEMEGAEIKLVQPQYFIPSETGLSTCPHCNGNKYCVCTDPECNGKHVYDCNKCNATGSLQCPTCGGNKFIRCLRCHGNGYSLCTNCSGSGSAYCFSCGGVGRKTIYHNNTSYSETCSGCGGSGRNRCNHCSGGRVNCTSCGSSGRMQCSECRGNGIVQCSKCNGKHQVTCQYCYGDNIENRFGKVNCPTCETTGRIIRLSYVDSIIQQYALEKFSYQDKPDQADIFSVARIKEFVDHNNSLSDTYHCIGQNAEEKYDVFSKELSREIRQELKLFTEKYPKLIKEAIYYEPVPFADFQYYNYVIASHHAFSILNIDKVPEIHFHDTEDPVNEKETVKQKLDEWLAKAFYLKKYREKNDNKNEMLLMLYLAISNTPISESRKKFLSGELQGFTGFTEKEKGMILNLFNEKKSGQINSREIYFSSTVKCEEVRTNLKKLIDANGGNPALNEKERLDEINLILDECHKNNPGWIKRFFLTWQISLPIILLLAALVTCICVVL